MVFGLSGSGFQAKKGCNMRDLLIEPGESNLWLRGGILMVLKLMMKLGGVKLFFFLAKTIFSPTNGETERRRLIKDPRGRTSFLEAF